LKRVFFISIAFVLFFTGSSVAQTTQIKKVIFQAFWWNFKNDNYPSSYANYLAELAPRLKQIGFDAIWIPPSYKNYSPTYVGYGPMDQYDLGDKFQKGSPTTPTGLGTKDELLRMIAVMHANGIEVIQDIVLNHCDGAGTTTGAGGIDSNSYSLQSNSGYKNFRYVSYATPSIDESQNDYWTRSGRWSKNYFNFHPNDNDNCITGDICSPLFGPDIDYTSVSFGLSSNIPTSGVPSGYPATRPYYNPPQSASYMYNGAVNWLAWFKKQTGVDGFRWDAVKHYDRFVQRDAIRNVKYNLGVANGGYAMTNVGEWIGQTSDEDAYVTEVAQASLGFGYEEHTGTFDFNLRAYGSGGSLYDMVSKNFNGTFDLSLLPGLQQNKRYSDYASPAARVHRTVPFVNSHDTFRPIVDTLSGGNFSKPLGDATGWDTGNELGGNGNHIDPREPRISAAYAVIMAMDGNPIVFFEDIFNLGTTGKRWSHVPTNTTDLPLWNDIANIVQCHQKLQFKAGDYKVRSSESGAFFPTGSDKTNHLVFERSAKAIIGVDDQYSTDQDIWIDSDFPVGTILQDYSGANGVTTSVVQSDKRVYIKTKAVNHGVAGVFGHGYSVWAPVPNNVPFTTVANMLAYLNYTPTLNSVTTQEWEMDNDLGDSNCKSLGQGGKTPDNSPNDRVAGKFFANAGTSVAYTLTLGTVGNGLTIDFYDLSGSLLHTNNGNNATVSGSFANATTQWITVKVRNTTTNTVGQKCYVRLSYTAPQVMSASSSASKTKISIWTSNASTNDWNDCRNWEEGLVPSCTSTVLVPHKVKYMPKMSLCFTGTFINRSGLTLKSKVFLQGPYNNSTSLMNDALRTLPSFPIASPYGTLDTITDTNVLTVSGNDAIVDWLKIELRDKNTPATVLQTRSALLQSDGDVVELDCVSPVFFNGVVTDNYYITIKHRNHLSVTTSAAQVFSENPTAFDYSTMATYGTNAQKNVGATMCMWAGDANGDGQIKYTNASNDRAIILGRLNSVLTSVASGYFNEDLNLDGIVKYTNANNDRSIILSNLNSILTTILITQTPQ